MTPYAHKPGPAGGVNAKPMGPRKSEENTLIELKNASSQLLTNSNKQYNLNLRNVSFNLV